MQTTTNIIDKNWKDLIKPNKLNITSSDDKSFAKVVAEPLEKGFGQTIGNSLRRILLASIQGAAVTAIQIDGVLHEFSSIKGVSEDVTDIVLNLKAIAVGMEVEGPKKLTLKEQGPKAVTAGDIVETNGISILNKDDIKKIIFIALIMSLDCTMIFYIVSFDVFFFYILTYSFLVNYECVSHNRSDKGVI